MRRFTLDFMFELAKKDADFLRCNFVTLENGEKGQHSKYSPFAITEQTNER
ncbi:hypothetical protein FACS1894181_18930 [Bacteroidia bacterium]|nr:hypothetical protein FACS1894181_18930 [Bacteroidia bacterium]